MNLTDRLTLTADAIFIGPNDLAMSLLNYAPARYDEPIFLRALDKITEAAKRHGKYVGILVSDGDAARTGAKRYNIVAVGGDVKALSGWMGAQVKAARSEMSEMSEMSL
jgi:4-hydroxy-2-oxoheptanedioate aldolase